MTGSVTVLRRLSWALWLRCPNCGAREIFHSWFRLKETCPVCRIQFQREDQGYQVGSYMFNIIVAELVFAVLFVAVLLLTWPDPPWKLLTWGGAALMVLMPMLFFPWSKTLFFAFDLIFRPAGDSR